MAQRYHDYRQRGERGPRRDWTCTCGFEVFGSKDECPKCGLFRSKAFAGERAGAPSKRPGDWNCPGCADLNFASRDRCRKCGGPRVIPAAAAPVPPVPVERPGDWHCDGAACAVLNFGTRTACFKCGRPKPNADRPVPKDLSCAVCLAEPANARIATCGHIATCVECAGHYDKCSVCRAPYTPADIQKSYIVVG
jgi:hypothetical protein